MNRLGVFVSSVQKELENERVIVQNLIQTDTFLSAHCTPILYEYEPASPDQVAAGCLKVLDGCQIYLLMIWQEYGSSVQGLSITHKEYRRAKARKLPVLAFVKGQRQIPREPGTEKFLQELDKDGFKYKRFGNVIELQTEVRAALVKILKEIFGISPSSDENEIAQQTIEATSPFESQLLQRIRWENLDHAVARRLIAVAEKKDPSSITQDEILADAILRGLVWRDQATGQHYATAAGVVLLAKDPSAVFPQARILADAYRGREADGNPNDQEDIRGPMPLAIDRAIAFIDRNTRHPMRVVRLNRIRLDEYPVEGLREALVNAVAHRLYEDAGRKIMVEVFTDRVVVSSPGLPPAPITLDKLRRGKYKPCSRNPVLAQCLSFFHRIEERGSGIRRMRDHMLNHGLDLPVLATETGYFQVIFSGPGDNLGRLRVPPSAGTELIPPAIEAKLNKRQKKIVAQVLKEGSVTSGWCVKHLGVVYDTANRDLIGLADKQIIERLGRGRGVKYVLKEMNKGT
ncbi:MAG: ATP-binding protein [Phycisphaerae bacterium]